MTKTNKGFQVLCPFCHDADQSLHWATGPQPNPIRVLLNEIDRADEEAAQVDEPLFTLPEWIAAQADGFRRLGTQAGELVASAIRELAEMVEFVGARTPHDAEDRLATLTRDHAERVRDLEHFEAAHASLS